MVFADSSLSIQHCQVESIGSVIDATNRMAVGQNYLSTQMSSLSDGLESISVYGIGFSEMAGTISIPLIIALFAFAFPFLFTVISHINNKYESERISELFSTEPFYKLYLFGAWTCAFYLVTIGVLFLCLSERSYIVLMHVMNWTSIIVAGFYSIIILCFVRTCIQYNNPQKLIGRMDARFWREAKKSKAYLERLKKKEKKEQKKKTHSLRRFRDQSISIGKSYAYYGVEDSRTRCLIELCKYAFRKNDFDLFLTVLFTVNKLPHPDKHFESQRYLFYEQVIDAYLYGIQNIKIEETLLRNWFLAFNRTEEPDRGIVFRMLGKMVGACIQGRASIFEQYILNASYGYSFINQLQIVSYVRGADVQEQMNTDKKRLDFWLELCDMHYIALAHLFSSGILGPVKTVLYGKGSGYGKLFPYAGTELLKVYARCKEHQAEDGSFNHYWFLHEVVGDNTDPDMLEKLTSLLLMTASEKSYQSLNIISKSRLKLICDAEAKMANYTSVWVKNPDLLQQFPQIEGRSFTDRFSAFIKQLEEADSVEQRIDDKNLLVNFVYALMSLFYGKPSIESGKTIYDKAIPDAIKKEITAVFWSILYGNSLVFDGLTGDDLEGKTEELTMGELSIVTYKNALMEHEGLYTHQVFRNMTNVFKSRFVFLFFQALSKMHIVDKALPINTFEEFYDKNFDDKAEYYIIDTGTHLTTFFEMDKSEENRSLLYNRSFKGAKYKMFDLDVEWYLRDVGELDPFKENLIIIRQDDLPVVVNTTSPAAPTVDFQDVSDRSKGIAAVSLTVNPNYVVKYNNNARVMRLKLEPIKK